MAYCFKWGNTIKIITHAYLQYTRFRTLQIINKQTNSSMHTIIGGKNIYKQLQL